MAATDLTAPLLMDLAAAYADAAPAVSLVSDVASPSAIAADLDAGRIDLGLVVSHNPDQFATPLGYVLFVVVVHPDNPVGELTPAQVRDAFTGRVRDWGQMGGRGGEIQVVSREANSEAAQVVEASALSGAPASPNALVAPTWQAMREAVSQNPNALGYLPLAELEASVRRVRVDSPVRALVVAVSAHEPAGPAREFLAWAQSEAGQRVVSQRYEPVK